MVIVRQSQLTGITRSMDLSVTQEQLAAWQAGASIQEVMPELSNADREFVMTGITDDEWNELVVEL